MPTPAGGYFNSDNIKIPGTTTVISTSLGWNKPQMMWWANQQGLQGKSHRDTAQAAASAGTLAHDMLEAAIHDREYVIPPGLDPAIVRSALSAFDAWRQWELDSRLRYVATEVALVSERHQYGATPDAFALRGSGRKRPLVLLDWKTSSGTYADHVIQLAAYAEAWEEVTGLQLTGGAYCCRFDKTTGGFSVKWWPREALAPAWDAFLALRQLYSLKGVVEALAK